MGLLIITMNGKLLKINLELKMNKILLIAVSVAVFFGLAMSTQPLKAQVFDEFGITTVVRGLPYQELGSGDSKSVIPANSFIFPPSETGTARSRDDGFFEVALPFEYEFNGEIYTSVWICVNGYVIFKPANELLPSSVVPKNGLFNFADYFFYFNASYPKNLMAPYMGDHFLRTGDDNILSPPGNKYTNSEISTGESDLDSDNEPDVFTVQWKNMNINYDDPASGTPVDGIKSSVASFQLKIYKSVDEYSKQGDFEFCYGLVGTDQTSLREVITEGAAIGVKGTSGSDGEFADFLNGLYFAREWVPDDYDNYDKDDSKNVTTTTTLWQPSGGSDQRVKFIALGRNQAEDYWGDGDANLSKLEGEKHGNMSQSRYVTVTDARNIIRAIVTRSPLPKERRREAYHADVNHTGRFIYYLDNQYWGWNSNDINPLIRGKIRSVYPKDTVLKKNMTWKNSYYGDSVQYILHDVYTPDDPGLPQNGGTWEYNKVLPSQVSSLAQIFFEANEYDAALILHYIGGRLTRLPYMIDSFPQYGKLIPNELFANSIETGSVEALGNNTYKVPVYLNGSLNGPLAVKASFNGNVISATAAEDVSASNYNDMLVIAGTGEFDSKSPICYVTVQTDEKVLNVSEIRFNDRELPAITLQLASVNETENSQLLLQNIPNPFTESTMINVNLLQEGNYTLKIYDSMGNLVKTFNDVKSGKIEWNGTDSNNNPVAQGVYVYRLTGDNLSVSKKMIISK